MNEKKKKLPDWKQWAADGFLDWYDRNKPEDLTLPVARTKDDWGLWGEEIYRGWYEENKPGTVEAADSNPNDPPPPPPGPVKP